MNVELRTLRQVALSLVNQTLDLRRFDLDIALTLNTRVSFDKEPGRLIWIVGEQDATWAVSMPADASDIEALQGLPEVDTGSDMDRAGMIVDDFI